MHSFSHFTLLCQMLMVQPNNTPGKWLAVCIALIGHLIIKEYARLFMN